MVRVKRDGGLDQIARLFALRGQPQMLEGGSTQVYRFENSILKQITATSFEYHDSLTIIDWVEQVHRHLADCGCLVPQLQRSQSGHLMVEDGWTAWSYIDHEHGVLVTEKQIKNSIKAILDYHTALASIPQPNWIHDNKTPWGVAHQFSMAERPVLPAHVCPKLLPSLTAVLALIEPIDVGHCQVIHGDLNPNNLLSMSGHRWAIIDLSPFWGTTEMALAIYANFIGPRSGNVAHLKYFEHITNFKQWLLRASLRMLLVMNEINDLDDWHQSIEAKAAQLVIDYVTNEKPM